MNEGRRQQSSNFSDRASVINCDNGGQNCNELLLNFDQGMDVNLYLEGNIDSKNLLLFYKQKIILLENQNFFLLNQNIFIATSNHGGILEKDMQLFFLSEISIYLN